MCGGANATDGINNRVDFVAFFKHVKGGESYTDFGPEASDNDLLAASCLDCCAEVCIFPRIDAGAVDLLGSFWHVLHEFLRGWFIDAEVDTNGGNDDGCAPAGSSFCQQAGVELDASFGAAVNGAVLGLLVVNENYYGVLWGEQVVGLRITDWFRLCLTHVHRLPTYC